MASAVAVAPAAAEPLEADTPPPAPDPPRSADPADLAAGQEEPSLPRPSNQPSMSANELEQHARDLADDHARATPSMAAKMRSYPWMRFVKIFTRNAANKAEDVGIGILGVTDAVAVVSEGVASTAVSGVGAVGGVVESGVAGALSLGDTGHILTPREVDTVTEVDISGTVLKDLNRQIEVEKMKGTNNAESPLNTPWILMIFPVFPIAFMYTKTALSICLPPVIVWAVYIWNLLGWRFWFCLSILFCLSIIIAWHAIKAIGPIRPLTMQVDVAAIKFKRKLRVQVEKQMPKIYKALDKILPPLLSVLISLDRLLTPKLGYSPLLAVNARLNGWIFDPRIEEIRHSHATTGARRLAARLTGKEKPPYDVVVHKHDRGAALVVADDRVVSHGAAGVEFDPSRLDNLDAGDGVHPVGDMFEQYFKVELCLRELAELHRMYTSVWFEWIYRGMVVDRSVIRDISTSKERKGYGASFDSYTLNGEVRLPLRADTTRVKGGFFDVPIKLVLKGRDGLPIYSNDGARRYLRESPPICVIGEIELSALRIGVGADTDGIVRSELLVPLHALGVEQYRAAILRASARIFPIDSSSYSYRQMLSPLPNGEWTVRINIFELRNLHGVDSSGSSDPFVSASVLGMTKKTDRQRQTQSCVVNQLLFFSRLCTGLEFEDEKIVINVMDWNRFSGASKIGVYTLDAKRMLELPNREMYRKWFALSNPTGGRRPAGFIKMSITVVPPGGSPPHHDDAEDKEELSMAKLLKNNVLKAPKMSYENWAVHITVGWADMLPRMSSFRYRDAIRGFVTFDYSGHDQEKSQTFISEAREVIDPNIGKGCQVLPQRRVIWNEEYILPLTIINDRVAQEGISLRLYHRIMPRLQDPFREDQLIGQVTVSFEELFKNMTTAVVRGDPADGEEDGDRVQRVALMKPRYYNFYGAPDGPADAYDKGVAFRGRILIGVGAKPGAHARPFLRSCPAPPRPKLEFYKMDLSVLRATELPLLDGWLVYVEGRIGLYQFGHTIPKAAVQNHCAEWDENCGVSIPNMQFPEDVEQIPDFFLTIWARKPATVAVLEERKAPDDKNVPSAYSESQPENEEHADDDAAPQNAEESTTRQSGAAAGGSSAAGGGGGPAASNAALPTGESGTSDGQWQPKAFVRVPAKHLICGQKDPRWLFMDYPGNDVFDSGENKVPGSILMSASLSCYDPMADFSKRDSMGEEPRLSDLDGADKRAALTGPLASPPRNDGDNQDAVEEKNSTGSRRATSGLESPLRMQVAQKSNEFSIPLGQEKSYRLRALILQGRNLPAADESGLSDPRVVVSMGDKSVSGAIVCKQTVSPLWEELIEVEDIKVRDGERKPNVNVLIYDDDGEGKKMQYLGRSIISCAELDSAEPSLKFSEWYPVFSVNPGVIVGEVLADFQLIPTDVAIERPLGKYLTLSRTDSSLRISLVGLRDVKFLTYAAGNLFVECGISGESFQPTRSRRGVILQQQSHVANCNILDVMVLEIKIPADLRLAPALNFYVFAEYDHTKSKDMVATACVPLERWLSEHIRRLLTGENLIDDSFGTDAPIPERLLSSDRNYKFKRSAKRIATDQIGTTSLRLHQVKSAKDGEKKNMLVLKEKQDVLHVGFPDKSTGTGASGGSKREDEKKGPTIGEKLKAALAPIRAIKYQIADVLADLMPDVSMALGIEVEEDVPLSALLGVDGERIDYDGTKNLKRNRGHCPVELEAEFSEPAYGEFLLFRGDNRSLGNTVGRINGPADSAPSNTQMPPILPVDEAPSTSTLIKREQRKARLEGSRPAVGKIKARLDLIEMNKEDEEETKKVRQTSLRSFGRVFVPTEVVVRVYVLRAINLQQVGAQCNPYLTTRFFGGYPDFYSNKHDPILDDDNPNLFEMFESRVKMPGGSVRIEVKDRVLPEMTLPVSYPMYMNENGQRKVGMVQKDVPLSIGKLGLGWSVPIGETVIDLDARWYNSAWRSLAKTPVETRSLHSEESANLKGQLEVFVDMFDAREVDRRPRMFIPVPISKPAQERYELRVVVYKIWDCNLPYKLVNFDPQKLAAFYVQARLGNRVEDSRKTELCRYVADGKAEFNWRMKWSIELPSLDIKPRLKLQVFDDTSHGIGDDQMCATADIKLRSLFDEIITNKKPIIKKRQWVLLEHPNHPEVQALTQISLELTTAELAAKKKCFAGRDGHKDTQHEDYILPAPFQPAAFSLYNPVPYFNYLIISSINNLQWTVATTLLIFPFIPMFVQFVFMLTPWQWYAAGGVCGLAIFVRLQLVSMARSAHAHAAQSQAEMDDDEEQVD